MSIRLKVIDALDNCIDSLDRRLERARALRDEVAKLPDDDAFFAQLKELKQSRFRSCRKLFDQMTSQGTVLEGLANIKDVVKKIDVQKATAETRYLDAGHPG
ncbi:MAG: hypothetical protein L0H63_14570 [Nitrococcus sp.]|nr:hypothetical protein [Nitrococcus sp.]